MKSLDEALSLFRQGRIAEAEALCASRLAVDHGDAGALALLGDIRLATGRPAAAIASLQALAALRPQDAANLRRLGAACLAASQLADSIDALRRALVLEPASVRAHNTLGQALLQSGDAAGAVRQFEQAITLEPDYAPGLNNLGMALAAVQRGEEAITAFERALDLDPRLHVAGLNLALALEAEGDMPRALTRLDRLIAATPRSTEVLLARRAAVLLALERPAEALQSVEAALQHQPTLRDALHVHAAVLCRLNRPGEALQSLDRALECDPGDVAAWCERAIALAQLDDCAAAVASFGQALARDPRCMPARTGLLAALIPAVPLSELEADAAHAAFERELQALLDWLATQEPDADAAWTLARQQFFYLSYREVSNRTLLERYRGAASRRLERRVSMERPQAPWVLGRAMSGRFRLGIVAAQVCDHSVFNAITAGWLRGFDRGAFEVSLFVVGSRRDATTQAAFRRVDHVEADPRSAAQWARAIGGQRLDAVLFPEVGIDRTTLSLASLRLAPRQLAAWGHPETTGLPTVDEYLSGERFEPPDADRHYSERLVRLPGLGVHYQPFGVAAGSGIRARHGIGAEPLFICPGTPFKYRPQDDAVLAAIAREVGACSFVFFVYERSALSRRLQQRLTAAFVQHGLDAHRYLRWLPWQSRPDFGGLLREADVFLDTIGFSGFNTLMQAMEAGLPAVACEGSFLRSRLGSGILRHLGLGELVAASREDYIRIAVKLATDRVWREAVRARLPVAVAPVYEDLTPVSALSRHLLAG